MNMQIVTVGTFVYALTWSCILSLTAIGITLLYRTTRVPNFAHASFVTNGVYAAVIAWILGLHPYMGIPLGFIISGIEAVILFYVLLEPLRRRRASIFLLMIATFSFDILWYGFQNILADVLQYEFKILSRSIYFAKLDFEFLGLKGVTLVSLVVFIVTFLALQIILYRTNTGIALRACMENPSLALTLGIDVTKMLLLSWFIAGATAGVAGALMTFYMMCNTFTGTFLVAEMFCASIVGGLGYLYGAPLGSFLVGFAKVFLLSIVAAIIGPTVINYAMAVPLIVLVVTFAFLPEGLASIRIRRGGA